MTHQKLEKTKGFSMIELMASIFILSFGIITIYGVFSNFLTLTNTISSRLTATYLAKEGMEIVRNIRDDNFVNGKKWKNGFSGCGNGCQADYKAGTTAEGNANKLKKYNDNNFLQINSGGFYGYDLGTPSKFKRKIIIDSQGTDILKITTQVFWSYSGEPLSFQTEGYLYNWY